MQGSSLLQLLASLDKEQMAALDRFLQSPYHNTNSTITKLFRYIRKYHPTLDSQKLSKEHAFVHLFPDESYYDPKIRKQMTLLKGAVEDFIQHERLRANQNIQQRLLILQYYELEDYEPFEKRIQQRVKALHKQPLRDAQYHLELLWLYEILFYHPKNKDSTHFKSGNIQEQVMKQLDLFFLLSKLRLETDFNIWKKVVNKEIPMLIKYPELEKLLPAGDLGNPLIDVYKNIYRFQQDEWEPSVEEFIKLVDDFKKKLHMMGMEERGFIYNALINIAIAKINEHPDFVQLATLLFKFGHQKDLILHRAQISPLQFLNVTIISSGAGAFEWVEEFMAHYEPYLPEANKQQALSISKGTLLYQQGKVPGLSWLERKDFFEKALYEIGPTPYAGFVFDLRMRSLQFRILYDLHIPVAKDKERKFFTANAKNFNKYLGEKNEEFGERTETYSQFIKYTKKLARIYRKTRNDGQIPESLNILEEKIKKDKSVALKLWLVNAVRELRNSLTSGI